MTVSANALTVTDTDWAKLNFFCTASKSRNFKTDMKAKTKEINNIAERKKRSRFYRVV